MKYQHKKANNWYGLIKKIPGHLKKQAVMQTVFAVMQHSLLIIVGINIAISAK